MGDDKVDFVKMPDLTGADDSTGSMNVRDCPNDDGETEIAIVYTDIEAPTATAISEAIEKQGHALRLPQRWPIHATRPTMPLLRTDGPRLKQSAVVKRADVLANVAAVLLPPQGGRQPVTITISTARRTMQLPRTQDESRDETMGTYNGAARGTYTCNTGNDRLYGHLDAKRRDNRHERWVDIHARYRRQVPAMPDYDYLHYGAWLKKTAQDDGSEEYNEVETFADSSLDVATTLAINGSATYKGGAAGVYVRNVYEPSTTGEQELDYATSGHFTAAVDLTATFTGNSVAVDDHNSVKGTINGFTLSGGEDASGWGVNVDADYQRRDAFTGTAKGGGADDGIDHRKLPRCTTMVILTMIYRQLPSAHRAESHGRRVQRRVHERLRCRRFRCEKAVEV